MTDEQKIDEQKAEDVMENVIPASDTVIPVKTGIQDDNIDSRLRGNDNAVPEGKPQKKSLFGTKDCKKCEQSKKEMDEYKQGWQRALADYKNLQKEIADRKSEWAKYSEAQVMEDFLPVYENFKKAFALHPVLRADNEEHKQIKNWIDGIGYIMKQFGDVMKSHNLEEIKTVGEKFDPKYHEAVGEEEAEGTEAGIILKEVDGGYKIGERVIKPSKVIITK